MKISPATIFLSALHLSIEYFSTGHIGKYIHKRPFTTSESLKTQLSKHIFLQSCKVGNMAANVLTAMLDQQQCENHQIIRAFSIAVQLEIIIGQDKIGLLY